MAPFSGITLNSKHGLRLSKTFKGLTLGFQGGRSLLRGHWSIGGGLINTNLSKSGLSFSTRSKFGTFNWTRPKRSSFKILGIQFRGLKAAIPALFFALITLTFGLVSLLFGILKMLPPVLVFLGQLIFFIGALIMRVAELAYHSLMFAIFDLPHNCEPRKLRPVQMRHPVEVQLARYLQSIKLSVSQEHGRLGLSFEEKHHD